MDLGAYHIIGRSILIPHTCPTNVLLEVDFPSFSQHKCPRSAEVEVKSETVVLALPLRCNLFFHLSRLERFFEDSYLTLPLD